MSEVLRSPMTQWLPSSQWGRRAANTSWGEMSGPLLGPGRQTPASMMSLLSAQTGTLVCIFMSVGHLCASTFGAHLLCQESTAWTMRSLYKGHRGWEERALSGPLCRTSRIPKGLPCSVAPSSTLPGPRGECIPQGIFFCFLAAATQGS